MKLRKASDKDVDLILQFIKGIAEYEHMENEVIATPELLREWLFEKKLAEVVFVLKGDSKCDKDSEREVGFVLYFYNFSTFIGKGGLYIEDLFVLPEFRGQGYGKALFEYVVNKAKQEKLRRVEWTCLDWNIPSIKFYKMQGAVAMDEWTNYRLVIED